MKNDTRIKPQKMLIFDKYFSVLEDNFYKNHEKNEFRTKKHRWILWTLEPKIEVHWP